MADLLLGQGREIAMTAVSTRPQPRQLAALGTVLCLYRPQYGSELSGWAQAVRVEARIGVESDGLREEAVRMWAKFAGEGMTNAQVRQWIADGAAALEERRAAEAQRAAGDAGGRD